MTFSLRTLKAVSIAVMVLISPLTVSTSVQAESLLEIYNKAVISDPSIREAQANMYATMEAKPQARADLLPQLDFSGQWQTRKTDGKNVIPIAGTPRNVLQETDEDSLNWSFDLTQTLFRWDQFARMGRADQEVSQAQLDYGAAQQDLMVRVSESYFNVLAARDTLASEQAAK
ncbi:MAG: TolC family protein, partial [Gammaproteobacteria bacterium]|nr:TolC family protein [Gammaproteobacteria bacterium]